MGFYCCTVPNHNPACNVCQRNASCPVEAGTRHRLLTRCSYFAWRHLAGPGGDPNGADALPTASMRGNTQLPPSGGSPEVVTGQYAAPGGADGQYASAAAGGQYAPPPPQYAPAAVQQTQPQDQGAAWH